MSDLYHYSTAFAVARFQDNTEKLTTMSGVTRTPDRDHCICCWKMRTAATGKYSKGGKFVCGMCHSPRRVS